MGSVLPSCVREHLAKILGMGGFDHAGERAAAAWQAHELIRQHDLTWAEVLNPPVALLPAEPARIWFDPTHLPPCEAAAMWLVRADPLTDWEVGFLQSIFGRRRLSPKQQGVLARIIRKCETFAEFAGADG